MAKTKYPSLVQTVVDYLRKKGFRQRALGFNRPGADEDCVEGVTIQRGSRTLQGQFTIELGVYVQQVQVLAHPDLELPRFPHAWHGTFRERLKELAGWKDEWWKDEKEADYSEIVMLLDRYGWPFLERWNSRSRIVENLLEKRRRGKAAHLSFDAVVILSAAGLKDEANEILHEIYKRFRQRNVNPEYVTALAKRLELRLPV